MSLTWSTLSIMLFQVRFKLLLRSANSASNSNIMRKQKLHHCSTRRVLPASVVLSNFLLIVCFVN